MHELADYPCSNCGWPAQAGKAYCETCDSAPYEHEDRPWYREYGEWTLSQQ